MNKNTTRINVIQLNGNQYDAVSGLPLNKAAKTVPIKTAAKAAVRLTAKPAAKPQHQPASHLKHHAQQRSHTLARRAVKKPAATATRDLVQATVSKKAGVARVNPHRLHHAQATAKSPLISRFGVPSASVESGGTRPQTAQLQPAEPTATAPQPQRQQSEVLFHRAMMAATTHKQPRHHVTKRKRGRLSLSNWSAATLAVLLLGGFVAYQNLASIQLRVASHRIGFSASVPSYRPAGFSMGPLSYQPGRVALTFHSNSDDRSFALSEQPTTWDAQTMYQQTLASSGNYHPLQTAGTTVYIDDQGNAAWISHGIWYQLNNHHAIAGAQLTDLVAST